MKALIALLMIFVSSLVYAEGYTESYVHHRSPYLVTYEQYRDNKVLADRRGQDVKRNIPRIYFEDPTDNSPKYDVIYVKDQ